MHGRCQQDCGWRYQLMTLQTSGAISLSQVQAEFGGSNPISMSEYYRGGANVPTSITSAGAYSGYQGSLYTYYWDDFGTVVWNGSTVGNNKFSNFTAGGFEYDQGSFFTSTGGGKGGPSNLYYTVRRRTAGSLTTVNTSIPASGTISMNQFYGGLL